VTARLFVYGTLAPGGEAWPVLARWVAGDPVADSVAGSLYDTGRGYPAATFPPAGSPGTGVHGFDAVHGFVVVLDADRADAALSALDRYEGDEYARIIVRTASGTEAFTYHWIAPLAGCRPLAGGRWRL
jgi:gamma-glutamylcyclotransferase (GGCT)/AIG2-like uncharacterized protein YtfP